MSILVCKKCKALVDDNEEAMEEHKKECRKDMNYRDLFMSDSEYRQQQRRERGTIELAYLRGKQLQEKQE